MSDKEQLEEHTHVAISISEYKSLKERVQELEEDNKNLQVLSSINRKEHMRIHEQNKRYRESLEFYADKGTYEVIETSPPTDEYQQPIEPVFKTVPIIYYDKGKEARKALESESE